MAKIIRCTDDVIEQIPNIMGHVYEYFGEKEVIIYAVLDEDNINFIVCDGPNCLYIKNYYKHYEIIPFQLKEDKSIGMIKLGSNFFYYNNDGTTYMVDESKKEHLIGTKKLSHKDPDGYDGFVYYVQYNPENDALCDMRYQQMYREVDGHTPIYSFHTKKIDVLSIDEQSSKNGYDKRGLLPRTAKYYTKYEFNSEEMGYTLSTIRDYGLMSVILNGAYNLQKSNYITRYVKTAYVNKKGNYVDFWPFARQLTTEELNEIIKSYGFATSIPDAYLDFYNGTNPIANEVQSLVKEMKDLEQSKDDRKCLIMQLIPEEIDEMPDEH